jgi:hypothetical protein
MCPHGIENYVSQYLREVRLLLDKPSLETTLIEMSTALVGSIEPADVLAVEPLHAAREVRRRRLDDEMEMVRHEDVSGDGPAKSSRGLTQKVEKGVARHIGAEDRSLLVPA